MRPGPGVYDMDQQLCGLQTCGQHPASDHTLCETEQWKSGVNICYLSEAATYTLPLEMEDLSPKVEELLG